MASATRRPIVARANTKLRRRSMPTKRMPTVDGRVAA
jgi:hypothetical protein